MLVVWSHRQNSTNNTNKHFLDPGWLQIKSYLTVKNENQLGKVHISVGDWLELDQFRLPRPDELLGGGKHLVTAAGLGVVEGGHGAAVVLDQLGHLCRCDLLDII